MAYREVSVIESREVLRLWLRGEGLRSIATLTPQERDRPCGRTRQGPPAPTRPHRFTTGNAPRRDPRLTFLLGPNLMAALNALLLCSLMYRSGLVPRVIPVWGLIGGPLLLGSVVAAFFGFHDLGISHARGSRPPDLLLGAVARHLHGGQGLQSLARHREPRPASRSTRPLPVG